MKPEVMPLHGESYRIYNAYKPTVKKYLYGSVALGFLNRFVIESEWPDIYFVHYNKNGMVRLLSYFVSFHKKIQSNPWTVPKIFLGCHMMNRILWKHSFEHGILCHDAGWIQP